MSMQIPSAITIWYCPITLILPNVMLNFHVACPQRLVRATAHIVQLHELERISSIK